MLFETGLRPGELLALWLEDVSMKKLRAVQAIIAALEQQQVHGLPKAQREYGSTERARLDAERAARAIG
jgi:hypothetical protein